MNMLCGKMAGRALVGMQMCAVPDVAHAPKKRGRSASKLRGEHYASRGLSLMEMLIALAISGMLLAAVAVALDASFKAYGSAAEEASAQSATRMVTHRLLTMIRTSTAHGPLEADGSVTPAAYVSGDEVISPYIEMVEPDGDIVRIAYDSVNQQLTMSVNDGAASPVLSGVVAAAFQLERSKNVLSQWELDRVTIDIQVQPNPDQTLAIESDNRTPIRVITSTMPRKLN